MSERFLDKTERLNQVRQSLIRLDVIRYEVEKRLEKSRGKFSSEEVRLEIVKKAEKRDLSESSFSLIDAQFRIADGYERKLNKKGFVSTHAGNLPLANAELVGLFDDTKVLKKDGNYQEVLRLLVSDRHTRCIEVVDVYSTLSTRLNDFEARISIASEIIEISKKSNVLGYIPFDLFEEEAKTIDFHTNVQLTKQAA